MRECCSVARIPELIPELIPEPIPEAIPELIPEPIPEPQLGTESRAASRIEPLRKSPMTTTTATPTPSAPSPAKTIGLVLLHGGTAAWIGYGALMKGLDLNPQFLPGPVLKLLTWAATSLPGDATAFLELSMRAIVGIEVFLALAILLSARFARPLAVMTLGLFCVILVYAIIDTARKDGWAEAMTGSCGCFGEKGLPATVMLGVDALLLASAIFLVPGGRKGSIMPLVLGAIAGLAVAVFIPNREVTVEDPNATASVTPADPATTPSTTTPTTTTPTTTTPATTPPATEQAGGAKPPETGIGSPWPPAPSKYERIYFPKFKEWVGQPFRDQKLALAIVRPMPEDIERGDWIVTFSRPDCDVCQRFYEDHFDAPRKERVLKVSINDTTGQRLPMDCVGCEEREVYRLKPGEEGRSPEYLLQTPCVIRLRDGVVVAVCTDVDNPEELAAVLSPAPPAPAAQAPAPAPTTPEPVAAAKAAWPGLPAKVEAMYLPDFKKMIGKPFADAPFARLIGGKVPDDFLSGRWIVVYYREDCDHCHELLISYFTGKLPVRTMAISIPDADPKNALENPCDECVKLLLVKGPNYIIGTPVVLSLNDGVVECVVDNVDDIASLEACLKFPQ